MKLLSTLRYTSSTGSLPGTGNYGGELRLFFTILNPLDWQPGPGQAPIMWQGGNGALDTYKLPNKDTLALNLDIATGLPAQLYIFGTIGVTTAAGVTYGGGQPIGQAVTLFVPGQPAVAILKGRSLGPASGLNFDVGFELAVPWDGTSADCHGAWWAVWR